MSGVAILMSADLVEEAAFASPLPSPPRYLESRKPGVRHPSLYDQDDPAGALVVLTVRYDLVAAWEGGPQDQWSAIYRRSFT